MAVPIYRLGCRSDETISVDIKPGCPFEDFDGTPRGAVWKMPPTVVSRVSKKPKDFVSFRSSIPCISERACEVLFPLISDNCEILPFCRFKNKDYFVLNVLEVKYCINEESSKLVVGTSSGRVIDMFTAHFNDSEVPASQIFKVLPRGEVFVKQPFVDLVVEHQLTGASFSDPGVAELPLIMRGIDTNIVPYLTR